MFGRRSKQGTNGQGTNGQGTAGQGADAVPTDVRREEERRARVARAQRRLAHVGLGTTDDDGDAARRGPAVGGVPTDPAGFPRPRTHSGPFPRPAAGPAAGSTTGSTTGSAAAIDAEVTGPIAVGAARRSVGLPRPGAR